MASNMGRIKSLERELIVFRPHIGKSIKMKYGGKIIKPINQHHGYKNVCLCKNNKPYPFAIHRLVAMAFLKNPLNKPCVNHLNGKQSDNRLCNLDWCTYSENEKHSYRVLGKKANCPWAGKTGYKNPTSKEVIQISMIGKEIKNFGSAEEAARKIRKGKHKKALGTKIGACCRGEQKTAYGYKWKYSIPQLDRTAKYILVK